MSLARRAAAALALAGALAGCAARPSLLLPGPDARRIGIAELIESAPLGPQENIRPTELRRSEHASVHLVRIRDREEPHRHTRYDLAVTLLGGAGVLWLDGRPLEMREGDVAVIPKLTPHYFVNRGSEPAAALVVFSPPFAGADQQPVE